MKVILKNVRLAFPKLHTPQAVGNSDPRYGADFIFEKDSDNYKRVLETISIVAQERFEDKTQAVMKKVKVDPKSFPLQSGDSKVNRDGDPYSGYEGMMYLRTSAPKNDAPKVLDRDRTVITEDNGKIYAGCFVNASVDIWVLDSKEYGRKICAKILAVQFAKDGESFVGGARADISDFEDLADFDAEDEDIEIDF